MSARDPFHEIKHLAIEIASLISVLGICGTIVYATFSKAPYPVQIVLAVVLIFAAIYLLIRLLSNTDNNTNQ
jgi:membrane protein implicated in regulation of membrane protease activity